MINFGLRYIVEDLRLHGYTDVDWAKNLIDKKCTSRCCFSLGFAMISWMRRKKKSISLSMDVIEYIATRMANYEEIWLRKLFG